MRKIKEESEKDKGKVGWEEKEKCVWLKKENVKQMKEWAQTREN